MLKAFRAFIAKEGLIDEKQQIILAVSGGMDSVVMTHLFKLTGYPFAIAHCNFQLRDKASDKDEEFVKKLASELKVPFHSTRFDTEAYAKKHKQSIQLAARELRYQWLEKMRENNQYSSIATAHHLNDSIETVLYNFTKGCGIRGLHGILPKTGKLIRPMLFASRVEIEAYVKQNDIAYREDASNVSVKYVRNKIRHEVIPVLQSINPAFEKTIQENIQRFRETEDVFQGAMVWFRKELITRKEELILIDFTKLPEAGKSTILFELVRDWGFNKDQVSQILEEQETSSGRQFFSESHRLVIGRTHYILSPKVLYQPGELKILAVTKQLTVLNKTFIFRIIKNPPFTFPSNNKEALLDFDQLKFPLTLRRWKSGDRFQPLGMNGHSQSLQDFFTHQKLSVPEKEKVWILESGGEICWVVGLRIDERFKVNDNSGKGLYIKVKTH